MKAHYIYIDDDPNSYKKIQGFENEDLTIETVQHEDSWEQQITFLKQREAVIDGLILDLKLDDLPNGNAQRANFRGTSLAQEIRTRQKERILLSFPIVLFSANDKLELALENSGKDLFDICIDKSNINTESFKKYSSQLIAMSDGYKELGSSKLLVDTLNTDISLLDSRFISELKELHQSPVHVQSRFLVTEFLEKQGPLIDEDILAARLGIDKSKSADWDKLLEILSSSKYMGIYCNGWPRWWMHKLEGWWKETISSDSYLRSTSASKRVEEIKKSTNLKQLVAATKLDKADSDEYWTVCKGYGRPLDPVDGLLIHGQDNLYSWQEPEYVSIDAALRRKNIDNWLDVADVEKERYKELKTVYSRKNQ